MNNYDLLAKEIVKYQESIIGPLAFSEAAKVSGLTVADQQISVTGEGKKVLESLVKQYEALFGQASVEACKEAIRGVKTKIGQEELPQILQ